MAGRWRSPRSSVRRWTCRTPARRKSPNCARALQRWKRASPKSPIATMSLRLYNTLTRSVAPFAPIVDGEVRMYVCGLTPSAEAHLGHARSFLFFDVLRRYLAHPRNGYRVTYVQNVTDIDDRSIAAAKV